MVRDMVTAVISCDKADTEREVSPVDVNNLSIAKIF